jgi:hypothetical protein
MLRLFSRKKSSSGITDRRRTRRMVPGFTLSFFQEDEQAFEGFR